MSVLIMSKEQVLDAVMNVGFRELLTEKEQEYVHRALDIAYGHGFAAGLNEGYERMASMLNAAEQRRQQRQQQRQQQSQPLDSCVRCGQPASHDIHDMQVNHSHAFIRQ